MEQAIAKTLFRSPVQNIQCPGESDITEQILLRITLDQHTQAAYNSIQQDLHQQRLQNLREKLESVAETSWLHPPIEKLLGLH